MRQWAKTLLTIVLTLGMVAGGYMLAARSYSWGMKNGYDVGYRDARMQCQMFYGGGIPTPDGRPPIPVRP